MRVDVLLYRRSVDAIFCRRIFYPVEFIEHIMFRRLGSYFFKIFPEH